MKYQRLFQEQSFDKKKLKQEYLEFKKFVISNRLTESTTKLNEGLIPSGLKDKFTFIKNISKQIGVQVSDLIKLFLNKGIFTLFAKMKWSILELWKMVKAGFDLYKSLFEAWAKFIRENKITKGIIQKTTDKIKLVNDFFDNHPNLKKVGGVLIAGLLVYIWLNVSFVGHYNIDFDISTIIDALFGKFDLVDLFLSENGIIMLTTFITGKLTGLTFPYPGSDLAKFAFAVIFTLAKKVKVKLEKQNIQEEIQTPEIQNLQYIDLSDVDKSDELEFIDVELQDENDILKTDLSESVKKKYVIRNGKKVLRYYTDNPNKKIKWINGKVIEVIKTSKEKMKRKKAGILRAKKMKSKQKQISLKRKKSMKKHTW